MRTLKLSQLREAGACQEQVERFEKLFGKEIKVTIELAERYANMFDWNFAAEYFLSAPLWETYKKARAPLWAKLYISDTKSENIER